MQESATLSHGLVLTEALEQLHRSGFVHGGVRIDNVFLVGGEARLGPPDLTLGLPGNDLSHRLLPEADVRSMNELVEALAQPVAEPSRSLREAFAHQLIGLLLGSRRSTPAVAASAAALRAALRDVREGRSRRLEETQPTGS